MIDFWKIHRMLLGAITNLSTINTSIQFLYHQSLITHHQFVYKFTLHIGETQSDLQYGINQLIKIEIQNIHSSFPTKEITIRYNLTFINKHLILDYYWYSCNK